MKFEGSVVATRILECPCSVGLAGAGHAELLQLGRAHADEHDRGEHLPNEFIREHVRTTAKDAVW
jgi:hypothetical protein